MAVSSDNNFPKGYFPLFIDLYQKKILVFGGGVIATRRIQTLLEFGADITVVAPDCSNEVKDLARNNQLVYEQRIYKLGEIIKPFIVLAATNNTGVNDEIYLECKEKGIMKNIASDRTKCDFYFPGIVKEDSLVIGITASGENHKRVKAISEQIRNMILKKGEKNENNSYRKQRK